jgi:hypothetical protein
MDGASACAPAMIGTYADIRIEGGNNFAAILMRVSRLAARFY